MSVYPSESRPDAALVLRRAVVHTVLLKHGTSQPSPSTVALLIQRGNFDAGKEIEAAKAKDVRFLRENGLWGLLTATEKEFMTSSMNQVSVSQLRSATSLVEPLYCLLWALRRCDRILPYDQHSDLNGSCDLMKREPAKALTEDVELRAWGELDEARRTAECWLWRSRMRELESSGYFDTEAGRNSVKGSPREVIRQKAEKAFEEGRAPAPLSEDFVAFNMPYRSLSVADWTEVKLIAIERFRALSWLCGLAPDNRWERVSMEVVPVGGRSPHGADDHEALRPVRSYVD